jgi:arylsulfatase A
MGSIVQNYIKSTLGLCVFMTPIVVSASDAAQRPNIIFFMVDDLGWADLPVYGNRFNEAPHITKLADEGIRFTNAYAASPVCSPSRASVISGQYPARFGMVDFIPGHWRPYEEVIVPSNRTQHLPEDIITIGEALQKAGYATGYFGKWHLGNSPSHHPINRGFTEANVGVGYFNARFNPPREQSSDKIISKRLTEFGNDFIEKNKNQPFFLFLSHWDVHCLLDAEMPMIEKYLKKPKVLDYPCNAVYAAMIENIDNSVAGIMQKLHELGIDDNTIFIFYSDNGGIITENKYPGVTEELMPMIAPSKSHLYPEHPLRYIVTSNAPLKCQKGSLNEGGIRVPLLVRWPAQIKSGSVSDALVTSVDFYPTLLEIAGADQPSNQTLDGSSLLPVLKENQYDLERAIYWHYPVYHHDVPASAIRKGNWKLIENLVTGDIRLYDMETDISESTDLSAVFPNKSKELLELLKDWQKEMNAEFPIKNPDFDPARRYFWDKHP